MDILLDFAERLRDKLPTDHQDIIDEVHEAVRAEYAGDRVYICKGGAKELEAIEKRNADIIKKYREGISVEIIAKYYWISRQRVYSILSKAS